MQTLYKYMHEYTCNNNNNTYMWFFKGLFSVRLLGSISLELEISTLILLFSNLLFLYLLTLSKDYILKNTLVCAVEVFIVLLFTSKSLKVKYTFCLSQQ